METAAATPTEKTYKRRKPAQQSGFDSCKRTILHNLKVQNDKSPKGSVDLPIVDLIKAINEHENYVTTSSCSGRICVFHASSQGQSVRSELVSEGGDVLLSHQATKGGQWLLASHETIQYSDVQEALSEENIADRSGLISFKHEPFIMHVQCRDLEAAKALLQVALRSGFRESGIVLGKKIMVGVRTTANLLELPIASDGHWLVDESYLRVLVELANAKFIENQRRTRHFQETLMEAFASQTSTTLSDSLSSLSIEKKAKKRQEDKSKSSKKRTKDDKRSKERVLSFAKDTASPSAEQILQSLERTFALVPDLDTPSFARRLGHCAAMSGGILYAFGGTGPSTQHRRCNDLFRIRKRRTVVDDSTEQKVEKAEEGERASNRWIYEQCLCEGEIPSPRVKSSLTHLSSGQFYLFGGRQSPEKPFGDLYIFTDIYNQDEGKEGERMKEETECHSPRVLWKNITATGDAPAARWSHSAVAGRDRHQMFSDVFLLETMKGGTSLTWRQLQGTGVKPSPRYSHTAVMVSSSHAMIVYGGVSDLDEVEILQTCQVFHFESMRWSTPSVCGDVPIGRLSHSSLLMGDRYMIVFGGVTPQGLDSTAYMLDTMLTSKECDGVMGWCTISPVGLDARALPPSALKEDEERGQTDNPSAMLLSQHSAHQTEDGDVLLLGGGGTCFAFGHIYNPLLWLELGTPSQSQGAPSLSQNVSSSQTKATRKSSSTSRSVLKEKGKEKAESLDVLLIEKARVKTLKTYLTDAKLYDKSRKIRPVGEQSSDEIFAVPVTHNVREMLSQERGVKALDETLASLILSAKLEIETNLLFPSQSKPKSSHLPPGKRINEAVIQTLQKHFPSAGERKIELPKKWEWVGDILMVPEDFYQQLAEVNADTSALWEAIANAAHCSRIAKKSVIDPGKKRQSHVELLYINDSHQKEGGKLQARSREDPGWVDIKENSLIYSFDITKVMFSSGNVTEKRRMGQLDCQGETIVDMYAGIGYYVIPFLVHAKASFVHALEWNEDSVDALRHNLAQNGVQDRCQVHPGDNRITGQALGNVADRINLGLLPSSEDGWPVAVHILKPTGGWMHVHANVPEAQKEHWVRHVETSLQRLGDEIGKKLSVTCRHLERVKSYAPRVDHLVADIYLQPRLE